MRPCLYDGLSALHAGGGFPQVVICNPFIGSRHKALMRLPFFENAQAFPINEALALGLSIVPSYWYVHSLCSAMRTKHDLFKQMSAFKMESVQYLDCMQKMLFMLELCRFLLCIRSTMKGIGPLHLKVRGSS